MSTWATVFWVKSEKLQTAAEVKEAQNRDNYPKRNTKAIPWGLWLFIAVHNLPISIA